VMSTMIGRRSVLRGALTGGLWMSAGWSWAAFRRTDEITTGVADPALRSFDDVMLEFMRQRDIPGGALAVSRNGKTVYSRGYGYADLEAREVVQPDALFRIASISKPFTSAAIMTLVQEPRYRLDLDTPVFPLLKSALRLHDPADPRLNRITVRHLLHHTGGWDRGRSGDPMFMPLEIARATGEPAPASARAIVRYMMGRPLDSDPGTHEAYSNFGYCVLGRLIEVLTGKTYEAYVRDSVLKPMGISRMRIGHTRLEQRAAGEVRYYQPNESLCTSIFPEDNGAKVSNCYGGWHLEAMDSHGGWLASASDLLRFAAALDFPTNSSPLAPAVASLLYERPLPPVGLDANGHPAPVYYGCGWEVRPVGNTGKANLWHNGSLPGTNTWLIRRWDGLAWAALFNQRDTGKGFSDGEIDGKLHVAAAAVKNWPR
jgi:CubicO group peptidase (beta-lactamase class C family)